MNIIQRFDIEKYSCGFESYSGHNDGMIDIVCILSIMFEMKWLNPISTSISFFYPIDQSQCWPTICHENYSIWSSSSSLIPSSLSISRTDDWLFSPQSDCNFLSFIYLLTTIHSIDLFHVIEMHLQLISSSFFTLLVWSFLLDMHLQLNKNIQDYWYGTRLSFWRLYRP